VTDDGRYKILARLHRLPVLYVGAQCHPCPKGRFPALRPYRRHETLNAAARYQWAMRTILTLCLAAIALIGGMAWAFAAAAFDPTSGLLTEHEKILKYEDEQPTQPYAMNFTDEAAQTLGIHNGRWEAFDTGPSRDGLTPSLSGGIDRGNAMIKLQWRPGQ
jgi:hypothetical protein